MNHASSGQLPLQLLILALLCPISGASSAVDGENPWNQPRVGPADNRHMSTENNTWSDNSAGDMRDAESSKYPPMDEDVTLGIDSTQMPAPAPAIQYTTPATPSTSAELAPPTPATGTYNQTPGNYGYTSPYSGSTGQYRNYPNYGYQQNRGNNWGGMWPGGSGGMWPGSSGGSGFPFGGSSWSPW